MVQVEAPAGAAPVSPSARGRASDSALPREAWPAVPAEGLLAELQGDGWTLVEFWGPDNLFCRLMAPVRAQVPRSHGGRLRLRCCIVATPAQYEACARWRVRLLPDLVLFRGARRVRRWGSGVDVRVLRRDLDALLGSADA